MATTDNVFADPPDFSEPWKFSDIVLVVEDQRFYVHRNILALFNNTRKDIGVDIPQSVQVLARFQGILNQLRGHWNHFLIMSYTQKNVPAAERTYGQSCDASSPGH